MKRNILTIFLASPGDLNPERQIVRDAVERANKILSRRIGWHIELLGWEDTLPGYNRPQELINKDVDACELFIGILWRRWGQSSGKFSSGFEEEFVRAKKRRIKTGTPELWLFFKSIDEESIRDPGDQLKRVIKFKNDQIKRKELFYKEFDSIEQWDKMIYDFLMSYVIDLSAYIPEIEFEEQSFSLDTIEFSDNGKAEIPEITKEPYPDDLIDIFNDTTLKLKNSLKISLDIWQASRINLLASMWFSQVHLGEVLGNHEINLIYLKRKEWNLSDPEKWFIFRSFISNPDYDHKPGWFWLNNKSEMEITSSLVLLSKNDRKESVRIGAAKLIYETNALINNETITDWLKSEDRDLIIYAIKLIKKNRIVDLLDQLDPFVIHNDSSIKEEAQCAMIEILYLTKPDTAFRFLIDHGSKIPTLISDTLIDSNLKVDNDLLFEALEKGESHLRLFCAKYLRKSKLLTSEKCIMLFVDPDQKVRREALFAYLELGHDIEMDVIKKIFPWPQKSKGLLANYAIQPVRPSEFWPILLAKKKPEDLFLMIDFFSDSGVDAYRILALNHFKLLKDKIRQDLDDEFEGLRKESASKLEAKFGYDITKSYEKDTILWIKSKFIAAALESLELYGNKKDLKYARKYLDNTSLNLADNSAINILKKYGSSLDVKRLTNAASNVYGEYRRISIEAAYSFSSNKCNYLKQLIESNNEKTLDLAISILSTSKTPQKYDLAQSLLRNEDEKTRLKGLSILVKNKSTEDIEEILSEYLSQDTYYYNVISWIDKLLYSKGIYQDYHKKVLFEMI